jgi:hypothetical protein
MRAPPKNARILRAHRLTPREPWICLRGAIYVDQAADGCVPFIDWLRTACTARADNQVSVVQRDVPTVPLVDASLQACCLMRRDLLDRSLPATTSQGDDLVAATLGAFTNKYREQRAETLAHGTVEGIGTPTRHFGKI